MSRKRQKVEHVSSEDGDDASFASFSDEGEIESQDANGALEEENDTEEESGIDEEEEQETEEISKRENSQADKVKNGGRKSISSQRKTGASQSNLFSVQVAELLQQIRPKHTAREVEAEDALKLVKQTIESIPARGPLLVDAARKTLLKEKIAIPFPEPQPTSDSNLKFSYAKPSSVNVVGSYPMKTVSRARKLLYVDMVLLLPSALFQEKDYLDYRYFHKRAFYLACVASGLRSAHSDDFEIRFQYHHDDPLRPVISIRPNAVSKDTSPTRNWQINILPAISEDQFTSNKLMPDRNCIRKGNVDNQATPGYNSSVRADMLVTAYLKLLHKASTTCEAFKDACTLGSTWLRQRGFRATSRKGGIANFEWSALVALLLSGGGSGNRPVISERWDGSQIFKAVLQLLATRDLIKQPLIIGIVKDMPVTNDLPLVWDAVRSHNILHKTSSWSYTRLQTEAKITLTMLGDSQFDGFEGAFILNKDTALLDNDVVIELSGNIKPRQGIDAYDTASVLYKTLTRGFGDRVKSINISADRTNAWSVSMSQPTSARQQTIRIGLCIKAETVDRTVDHGPAVDDKIAAADFRAFWGDKAELRRFKDGSITEALIWQSQPPVLQQIFDYLLDRHFESNKASFVFSGEHQARILGSRLMHEGASSGEAFTTLEHDIRGLEGLPLPIKQIVPAEMTHAASAKSSRISESVPRDVVMQFESSGRWPDDLAAIQRTKIAFLLKIDELLKDNDKDLTSRIGLENQEHDIRNQAFLEVVYNSGSSFHIRIFHDREQTLLERRLKDRTLDQKTIELAASGLVIYKREYLKRPTHAQAMTQLCSRHAALRGTIDALQKWLASHVLANHIDKEVIELIVARTFVQPWPWLAPNSVQTGFLRTLSWLARWDWRFEPLIVDLSGNRELKPPMYTAIRTRFEAWRKLDPALNRVTIFAASNVDEDGSTYTTDRPSKVIVSRLSTLARAAISEVQTKGIELDMRALFSSSLLDYNFIIHLSTKAMRGTKSTGKSKGPVYKNLELDSLVDSDMVGYSPAREFLHELDTTYGSAILFCSGFPERSAIGGLWTPQTADRAWKVNLSYSTTPVLNDNDTVARINKKAILAEIARLGGDMIERIEIPKRS